MARHYCFTSFDVEAPKMGADVRYLVFQRERCPSTGKEHWQGYVEFTTVKKFTGAGLAISQTSVHFEKRAGTRDQARTYCMKEDSRLWGPYEYGTWIKGQGARSDVKSVADCVKEGWNDNEIANEFPREYMRMAKGISLLRAALTEKRRWKTNVEIYWGPTGTGKSLLAHEQYPDAYIYTGMNGWWDGYDGQEDVIVEDFRPSFWSCDFMLRICDRYPMRVNIKGSSAEFVAKNLIFTSNLNPTEWYPEQMKAVMRRVDFCELVDGS